MADARAREAPPPPVIGKVGRYTVFLTPPRASKPGEVCSPRSPGPEAGLSGSPGKVALLTELGTPSPAPRAAPRKVVPLTEVAAPSPLPRVAPGKVVPLTEIATPSPAPKVGSVKVAPLPEKTTPSPPPVQVPPLQFEKPAAKSSGSVFGLFWDTVVKVQDAHSSLDEYLADWFGLNQSKYQWALNDYFENTGKEKEGGKGDKPKEIVSKGQAV